MAKKAESKAEVQDVQAVAYTKEQLLKSEAYQNRRDLVNALLDDNKKYTKEQVNALMDDFMKRAERTGDK